MTARDKVVLMLDRSQELLIEAYAARQKLPFETAAQKYFLGIINADIERIGLGYSKVAELEERVKNLENK